MSEDPAILYFINPAHAQSIPETTAYVQAGDALDLRGPRGTVEFSPAQVEASTRPCIAQQGAPGVVFTPTRPGDVFATLTTPSGQQTRICLRVGAPNAPT